MEKLIRAKCDASYKSYNNKSYIGIGLTIRQHNGIQFTENKKYYVDGILNSYYAELVGIIELLKKLQKIKGEQILVISDNEGLIININKRLLKSDYQLEFSFLQFLINNIKLNNEINFKWQPREKNVECDKLSKKQDTYNFKYELLNNKNGLYQCQAFNEFEAQLQFQKFIDRKNKEIESLENKNINRNIEPKKQSKSMFNKMMKEFKKTGTAYKNNF